MDEKVNLVEVLTRQVENLQRERDELRKDIEQLCMQQAGPGYVSVATRMLTQRTAALEQDIENLQKKLGGCLRENQNLQEELAEAYRIKLHGAALSKVSHFDLKYLLAVMNIAKRCCMDIWSPQQSDIFHLDLGQYSLLDIVQEAEEQVILLDVRISVTHTSQISSDAKQECGTKWARLTTTLAGVRSMYQSAPKEHGVALLGFPSRLDETVRAIALLLLKIQMRGGLQSNLRMGLEIEQHLQRNARILEKRQALYDGFLRNGLSKLQKFYTCQKAEIMKILEEESLRLMKVVAEIQDKLTEFCINTEVSDHPADKIQCCDSSCKHVHVTKDISPSTCRKSDYPADLNSVSFDESKALAQALQEKMEALMLFSQEQERYLLEKQRDLIVIEELQKNLSQLLERKTLFPNTPLCVQVKDEKVKVLMELTKLKEQYLLLKG
ncbi:hypothetical protein ACJX0J_010821, partial [Zea mays]